MRSKAILMALLALAIGGVEAAPITKTQVAAAARQWARSGQVLGARLGSKVLSATEFAVTNGYSYYAVRMANGGTVFMSSDSEMEPVIAFVGGTPDLSAKSPLRLLLDRDIRARAAMLRRSSSSSAPSSVPSQGPLTSGSASASALRTAEAVRQAPVVASRKWKALLSAPSPATGLGFGGAADPIKDDELITDLRVAPLLKTQWSQTTDVDDPLSGKYLSRSACYNYYTWQLVDGATIDDWPCGCTATAAAQILRFFEYPAEGPQKTYDCMVDGAVRKLTTIGGTYDWANMPDHPGAGEALGDDAKLEAIGRLTYDAGVALKSVYSDGLGSAIPEDLGVMYRNHFGYPGAWVLWDGVSFHTGEGGLHNLSLREKVIYTNLDAGRPVQFAIYGYPKINGQLYDSWAGHSVVGDGYGFVTLPGETDPTAFVHVNLGWNGSDDAWYNIPEIDCASVGASIGDSSGYDFLYLGGAVFNLATNETEVGELLTGRIVDDEGKAFDGATVFLKDLEGNELATYRTAANGIYSFVVKGGRSYEVTTTDDSGALMGDLANPVEIGVTGSAQSTNYVVAVERQVGNSWGNDMTLKLPTVQIAGHGSFTTLDKAIEYAGKNGLDNIVLDVVLPTVLRKAHVLDFSCEIKTDNGSPIEFGAGAGLVVSNDTTVYVHDIAFSNAVGRTIEALPTAVLKISGAADVGEILLADKDNLRLAGPLTVPIVVDAPFAKGNGEVFGRFAAHTDAAGATANFFLNKYDDESGGEDYYDVGEDRNQLRWKYGTEVPDAAAAARYEDDGGSTNYRSLAALFRHHQAGGTVTVIKDAPLTNAFELTSALKLVGQSRGVTLTPDKTARFTIREGGALTISNLTVRGYAGTRLFHVCGGAMTLERDAVLRDLVWSDCIEPVDSDARLGGVTAVESGTFTMLPGSKILDCEALGDGEFGGWGGGLYACGGTLDLRGGEISGCLSVFGGGVCADAIYGDLDVRLSGDLQIFANWAPAANLGDIVPDNLCVTAYADDPDYESVLPKVVGPLSDLAEIGVSVNREGGDCEAGDAFATVASEAGLSAADLETAEQAFFNDVYLKIRATSEERDGRTVLCWAAVAEEDGQVDPADAWALVVYGEGTEAPVTNYYGYVEAAFESLTNDATVVVLYDDYIAYPMSVTYDVQLRSATETPCTLSRYADAAAWEIVPGASLVVSNLTLDGCRTRYESPFLSVAGGALTLGGGATVCNAYGKNAYSAAAVLVLRANETSGSFTMEDGSLIASCQNNYKGEFEGIQKDADAGLAGGVVLQGGNAYLRGGEIKNCRAYKGGAVFVGNDSVAYVSGNFVAKTGNSRMKDNLSADFTHDGNGLLCLDGEYAGTSGVNHGWDVSTPASSNVFGFVSYDGDLADLTTSAAKFYNDRAKTVTGVIVTNETTTLLVWTSAIQTDEEGHRYYEETDPTDGKTVRYGVVDGSQPVPPPEPTKIDPPTAVAGLVYSGNEQTGVVAAVGFTLTGNIGTNAGPYTATATLEDGYAWRDGSSDPLPVDWSIAKATYDMSGVVFTNVTYVCDGTAKSNLVDEATLPAGVTVTYVNNGQTEIDTYTVTAKFTGDSVNYEPIDDMTATLTIIEDPTPPDPPPGPTPWTVVTNQPSPIAFKSITRVSETEWTLVVTNREPYCNYRLIWTDDLTMGFTSTGAWEKASGTVDPVWTTNVITTGGAWFWRAEGTEGTNMVPPQAEQ